HFVRRLQVADEFENFLDAEKAELAAQAQVVNDLDVQIDGAKKALALKKAYLLPEIFAGLKRKGKTSDFPALYPPGANIPQGWASGSIFQMVQTVLGLRADAPNKRLYVNPTLPKWFSDVELRNLRVGPCSFTLHFWR